MRRVAGAGGRLETRRGGKGIRLSEHGTGFVWYTGGAQQQDGAQSPLIDVFREERSLPSDVCGPSESAPSAGRTGFSEGTTYVKDKGDLGEPVIRERWLAAGSPSPAVDTPIPGWQGSNCQAVMSHAMLPETLDSGAVWSVARGLARTIQAYKRLLANCDLPRRNDLDGRGTLSEEALAELIGSFLPYGSIK